jgi:L-amino acid N-acyltransferase YncA
MIRPATSEDLPQVAAIFGHYALNTCATFEAVPPGVDKWAEKLAVTTDRGWPFLVTTEGADVLGLCYCSPWRTQPAYLHTTEESIYLAPEQTGRGLGRPLLTAMIEALRATDVRQVLAVIADAGDPASASLHRSLGFTEVGRLTKVGRKFDRWLDTVLYQRAMDASDG